VQLFEAERGSGFGDGQVYVAKALWQIRPDPRWLEAVIDALASADEPVQRQTAAEALYDASDPATARALVKALDDPDGLVRHHAARGLLALHGLPDKSVDPQHMMYRVMSETPLGTRVASGTSSRPSPGGRSPRSERRYLRELESSARLVRCDGVATGNSPVLRLGTPALPARTRPDHQRRATSLRRSR
jgi:hypothetical protein